VDRDPSYASGDDFGLSGVDPRPDAEFYAADRGADFERRLHRARSTVEHRQESVAGGIYLGSAVTFEDFPDECVMAVE
jgi:hypothetical protein